MTNVPWLPYLMTEFIDSRIRPSRWGCLPAFEWGSGASTFWLAARCQHVVTVEHDKEFIRAFPPNVELLFKTPEMWEMGDDPSEPSHYRSVSTDWGPGRNWQRYAMAIDSYELFDLILIDGRARASCISRAVSHVRPGGWLVVDNTGDRPWYLAKTIGLFEGWERATFYGRGPILDYPWEATAFGRPKE